MEGLGGGGGVTLRSIQGTYVARMVVVQGCVEWHTPQGLCHELCSVVAMRDTQDACVVSCSFYIILLVKLYQVSLFNFFYLLSDVFVMLLVSTVIGKACDHGCRKCMSLFCI